MYSRSVIPKGANKEETTIFLGNSSLTKHCLEVWTEILESSNRLPRKNLHSIVGDVNIHSEH